MTKHLVLALALAGCSDGLNAISTTELVLDTPADGDDVYTLEPMAIRAHAANTSGIRKISLFVAEREVHSCTGGDGLEHETLACETSIDPRDFAALQKDGTLHVSVTAFDGDDEHTSASADVKLTPLRVKFLKPVPDAAGVDVKGTTPLKLDAVGELPIQQIAVTFDADVPLQLFESAPYETMIDWKAFVGTGPHTLVATATDAQNRTAKARLTIRVQP